LNGAVPSDAMASFPLAMIPGFIVPFYVITHLIVFLHLRANWRELDRIHISAA
jgi:hypothetical protein